MPEESLTLNCPTPVDKMEWLKALQSAICQALKANGVSMVATSPTSGSTSTERSVQTTPPLVRSATYTFTKLPHLKDVTYSGNPVFLPKKRILFKLLYHSQVLGCAGKCKEKAKCDGRTAGFIVEASDKIFNTASAIRNPPDPMAPFMKAAGKMEK